MDCPYCKAEVESWWLASERIIVKGVDLTVKCECRRCSEEFYIELKTVVARPL